ncbi:hypothetical protein P5673_005217 [Acropora cervicornis]|uniref:Uncharacterized protein n=1 Tax=Acropora cervicornis TaxID=6130 RepID=A0AAD9VDJ1_ACRCE|nr:hypothetical protein P5673_005217 [Acropora cervicornis]
MYDVEANQYGKSDYSPFDNTMAFSDVSIRAGFIRKSKLHFKQKFLGKSEPVKTYAVEHQGLFYGALAVTVVTMIAMACCESVRRTFPTNMIFLSLFVSMDLLHFVKAIFLVPSQGRGSCHYHLCLPNKVRLHYDGGNSFCGVDYTHLLWILDDLLSQQSAFDCLCVYWSFDIRRVPCV